VKDRPQQYAKPKNKVRKPHLSINNDEINRIQSCLIWASKFPNPSKSNLDLCSERVGRKILQSGTVHVWSLLCRKKSKSIRKTHRPVEEKGSGKKKRKDGEHNLGRGSE
jgi:hypothetical protein